jgi:heme A synthase
MLHRTLVLSGGLLIVGALYAARGHWRGTPMLAVVYVTAAALALEVAIGWLQVSLGLPAGLRALHLALATVVWGGAVLMACATQLEGAEESMPQERRRPRVAEVGLQP